MTIEVTPAFPTLIGRFRIPDADAMNQDLQALILAEQEQYASLGRSNIGGMNPAWSSEVAQRSTSRQRWTHEREARLRS